MKSKAGLYLIFLFGILWHSIPATRDMALQLTMPALILSFIIIIYPDIKDKNYRVVIWLTVVSIITYFIELIGVRTSMIFGVYSYGDIMGMTYSDVPLVIGLNWGIIIWGCSEIAGRINTNTFLKILIAAAAAVFLDFLIEPVAMHFGYWTWGNNLIPLQNYAAWFIISIIFSSSYFYIKGRSRSSLPVHFYLTQILFFGTINLTAGLIWE